MDQTMIETMHNPDTPEVALDLLPETPDAGRPVTVTARIDLPGVAAPQDLRVVLTNDAGDTIATAPLLREAETATCAAVLTAMAPDSAGAHRWQASLDGPAAPGARGALSFHVAAHGLRPVVWDIPPAIETGADFTIRAGLRCTSGCRSAGWSLCVRDADGAMLATATVGDVPADGTEALFFATLTLRAPDAPGHMTWQVLPLAHDRGLPHVPLATPLAFNVVARAEHVIRVRALDMVTGDPIARAKVVAHPFRTFTDAEGMAELAVPRGVYTVFVSGKQYFPVRTVADVATEGDIRILAEMQVDRAYDEVDQWA